MAGTNQVAEINKSGFPFQIAVEDFFKRRAGEPTWRVVASEVPWSKGYIDLVARCGSWIAIIECKRVQDQSWLFLADESSSNQFTGIRALYYRRWHDADTLSHGFIRQVMDIDATWCEPSFQSRYCVLSPTKDKPHRVLEGIASELVAATCELADGPDVHHETQQEVILPVIVTTANIAVCRINRSEINLQSGTLERGEIEPTDMVRFRKPLAKEVEFIGRKNQLNVEQLTTRRERTVFIVTPNGLERFLFGARRAEIVDPHDPTPRVLS